MPHSQPLSHVCDAIFLFQTSLLFSHTSGTDVCLISSLWVLFSYSVFALFFCLLLATVDVIPTAISTVYKQSVDLTCFVAYTGCVFFFTAVCSVYTPWMVARTGTWDVAAALGFTSRKPSPSAPRGWRTTWTSAFSSLIIPASLRLPVTGGLAVTGIFSPSAPSATGSRVDYSYSLT